MSPRFAAPPALPLHSFSLTTTTRKPCSHPHCPTMMARVDLLILGAGWTSTFLIPLCAARGISHAATTRDGRDGTILFAFDPAADGDDPAQDAPFRTLPNARTVLVTFPLYVPGAATRLVRLYRRTHADGPAAAFVQLGSTGIWDVSVCLCFACGSRVARYAGG